MADSLVKHTHTLEQVLIKATGTGSSWKQTGRQSGRKAVNQSGLVYKDNTGADTL